MKKQSKQLVKPVQPGGMLASGLQQQSQKLAMQYGKTSKKMGKGR